MKSNLHYTDASDTDTLVRVQGASKKFCLSLKKSLYYGLIDMGNELIGRRHGGTGALRPKEFWAVRDVSFEIRRGECLALIGRNGAGKTTLLKMLNGLIKPDAGRIEMHGRVGAMIALGAGFNPILTGRENIFVNASVLGLSKSEIDAKLDEIIAFAEIDSFIDTPVQNYSSGMAVRLGFAVAASIVPDILLIDEVLAVGDISFVFKCLNRISEILPRCAVIFVSHSMPFVSRICTSVLVLEHGKEKYAGTDVPRGIELYSQNAVSGTLQNTGGSAISLISIGLRSKVDMEFDYSNSFRLKNGSPFEAQIAFKSEVDVELHFSPFIKIIDQQLREVLDVVPSGNKPMLVLGPRAMRTVRLCLDAVYLNSGGHSVVVGAYDPCTKNNYCRVTNAANFYNQSDYHGWATTIMSGQWDVLSG